jgi:flavin-binding protein dodecin
LTLRERWQNARGSGAHFERCIMSVAKVIEITSTSTKSFEDAVQGGIARASKTVDNVEGAWIKEQKITVRDGKITGYRVNMMVTFVISE